METTKTTQPSLGTWDKLPTQEVERKPKVAFDVNIPVEVTFVSDTPREFMGDTGAYYVFDVVAKTETGYEERAIVTSAWTLLRALKVLTPLKNKKARITKKLLKGKQQFEVIQI